MKKFKFRYEKILKMRLDKENELMNKLGELNYHKQQLIEKLDLSIEREKAYGASVEELLKSGCSAGDLFQIETNKGFYKREQKKIKGDITNKNMEIKMTQDALYEAMKERKTMEKLKEKAYGEFIDAINEADNKVIEEIVNYMNSQQGGE